MAAPRSGARALDWSSSFLSRFGFLVFDIGREPIEALRPEAFVAAKPIYRFPHRRGPEPHRYGAPGFRPGDEAGIVEHVEMLHHRRQLDREGLRQRADGCAVFAFEPGENRPPSRVDERRKCPVEPFAIVHHVGKYRSEWAG